MKNKSKVLASAFGVIGIWILFYNIVVFKMGPLSAFFGILDTVNSLLIDSFALVVLGCIIASLFVFVDICVQILSDPASFHKIDLLYKRFFAKGMHARFLSSLLVLRRTKTKKDLPSSAGEAAASLALLYTLSFLFIFIFSEALFFLTRGSGFNVTVTPLTEILIPTIAIAIPLSARMLSVIGHPKAEEYSKLLPSSFFTVLLISLVAISSSINPYSFILETFKSGQGSAFLSTAAYLAFIPVLIEAIRWHMTSSE